ncbi:MAG: hypothetical protein N2253_00465 [Bacteroidia bacterium]|nr:hypothetical protein [Bacteroidia bacterium]MCX7763348.1 hypothetical protein [Bacteroidia bacterium]MDW8057791.1 hypothetical protein [Bacteroidia bacterium]
MIGARLRLGALALLVSASFVACKKKKDEEPQPQNPPQQNPTPTAQSLDTLRGELTTERRLDSTKKYLIIGNYIVRNGGILRIPAGTVIFGDRRTKGTLIIDRGGKIFAEGTPEKPIVFTSKFGPGERDRGDWGGVIILGNARVNQTNVNIEGVTPPIQYGGQNDDDNSGVFRYVRIEYAGVALTPNNEVNSLTMGGVGRGTQIDHVQVSYGGDDGFEWFGGTVNAKYLVSYATWDDDFDADFGWSGNVQFALAIRDPFGADQSGSNGFECDNDAAGSTATPQTSGVFSNVTVIGPLHRRGASRSGNYQNAIHLRRNTAVSIFNSFIGGFPTGLRIDGTNTLSNYTNANGAVLQHNVLFIDSGNVNNRMVGGQGVTNTQVQDLWNAGNNQTVVDTNLAILFGYSSQSRMPFFVFIEGQANPNLQLPEGSPLATGADFSHSKLSGGFFEQVPFRGALRPDRDWTDGWCNFDPANAQY